jgi:NitT/TauT family transport system ATP-binding protein
MSAPVIATRAASVVFGSGSNARVAFQDVSVEVAQGEFLTVVGPSGCGKSTFLRVLAGLIPPTQGTLEIATELRAPGAVQMVFQEPGLLAWRRVIDNVMLPAELLGLRNLEPRARELLDQLGLADVARSYPHQLSGGMRQRAAICRALLTDPSLLLMDEPFGALDAITRERMNQMMQDIWSSSGAAVVLVTHSIDEAVYLSDRMVSMSSHPGTVSDTFPNEIPRPRGLGALETELHATYAARLRRGIV